MTVMTIAEATGTVAPAYEPSGLALVPDLTPVRAGTPDRPDRTCVAPLPGQDGQVGDVELCGNVLGRNGATRRARTGQRFCSDDCQRRGRRHERTIVTADYAQMARRVIRKLGERAATDFDDLAAVAEVARAADDALRQAVTAIRASRPDVSWAYIGDMLGITRQGAQQRFGK